MGCVSSECRSVTYAFSIQIDVGPPGPGGRECPPLDDEEAGHQARKAIEEKMTEKLATLYPDVDPQCVDGDCICKYDDPPSITTFAHTLPKAAYTVPLDMGHGMPVRSTECTYEVGGTVSVTRTTQRGSCALTQEAINRAFKDR